jgi:N-hydroxyarylamine O-acetyltransferase
LAGDDVREFLQAWLDWGTGGTCWAGNGALCMLLSGLGFNAERGIATMMAAPDLPPNHGTVVVALDNRRWLVDASMLYGKPLLLDEQRETAVAHPARGVRCTMRDGRWQVRWRPLHHPEGFDCRIEAPKSDAAEFSRRHEATLGWSPFNYEANARRNLGDHVVGLAFGHRVELLPDGSVTRTPIDAKTRLQVLVDEVGIAPELAAQVPADQATPPPPWSATAAANTD